MFFFSKIYTLIFDSLDATPEETLLTLKLDSSFCNSSTVVFKSPTLLALSLIGF